MNKNRIINVTFCFIFKSDVGNKQDGDNFAIEDSRYSKRTKIMYIISSVRI